MRILAAFLFTVCLQCCIGTDQFERINRRYVLINKTERFVELELFQFGVRYYTFLEGSGIIYDGLSSNDAGATISAYAGIRADSIVVTFDSTRQQIYYYDQIEGHLKSKPEVNRHPLDDSYYVQESNERYVFPFTEDDYNRAEVL